MPPQIFDHLYYKSIYFASSVQVKPNIQQAITSPRRQVSVYKLHFIE